VEWPNELRAWASFYSSQKESSRWGVRDPDMSDQGTGYVRERLLEPDLSTKHVRCRDLTRVKTRRPDMSGPWIGCVRETLLEPGDPAG
jgi:hypothetical protein